MHNRQMLYMNLQCIRYRKTKNKIPTTYFNINMYNNKN